MSPELRSPALLHRLVLAAAISAATAHLGAVASDWEPHVLALGWMAAAAGTLGASWWWMRRFERIESAPAISPIVVLLYFLPFVVEGGLRLSGQPTHPLEVVLITGTLLTGLGLSSASGCEPFQPLAMTCSLFVVLFAASISSAPVTCVGAAGLAVSGSAWLAARHWSSFAGRAGNRVVRRSSPWRGVTIGMAALLIPLSAAGYVGSDRIAALAGFMPSSGGTGGYDPAARSGVGDGDALVAGEEDVQSFGPIEDAPFRDSEEPSLYDLFNESYDEPFVNRRIDRAIALPPEFAFAAQSQMAKSQRAGKEFSTHRKKGSGRRESMSDLGSTALFYVKGRTPLHLRHEAFDLFDGVSWHAADPPADPHRPSLRLEMRRGRPWVSWTPAPNVLDYLAAEEPHAVKIVHLKSNRLPTPSHLRGVHLDLLDDASLFLWDAAGLLRMDRDSLPELTAFHYRSQAVDASVLREQTHWGQSADPRCRTLPAGEEFERIRVLAESWTAGIPRGWRQIEAVAGRLREEYVLDREARPPDDSRCPVAHFLFESRRGPEYQFATAAAVMLRSLGYSTRLVGGFYVSPERYDGRARHTPVLAADTHVWAEVLHSGWSWIPVEGTPGYETLGPPPAWWERGIEAAMAMAFWLASRWPWVLLAGLATGAAWRYRDRLLDTALVWRWRLWPARELRARITQTLRLVDSRLKLVRQPRPNGCPPAEWYRRVALRSESDRPALLGLARMADWAAFAPPDAPLDSVEDVAAEAGRLCRLAVVAISPDALRSLSTRNR